MSTESQTPTRSQTYKHNDLVAWLTENGHITPDSSQVEVVAAAFARRNEYRATDRYRALAEAGDPEKAAKAEAAAAAKAEAKVQKDAERAAVKAEKEAAREAAKAEKAAKAQKEAAPAAPAKATKTSKKASKATADSGDEDPFA
jgi:hypothetical protein